MHRLVDPLRLLHGQLVLFHQLVHVEPITGRGGNASGGGVGLFQIPHLLQGRHLIPDGGGGTIQLGQVCDDLGAYRLSRLNVMLHYRPEDPFPAFGHVHLVHLPFLLD